MNLRGVRESGKTFAVPTYLFIIGVTVMIAVGLGRAAVGDTPVAESAGYHIEAEQAGLAGLGLMLLALRAFSSGCTALTGVEAISNGVPAFRPPKSENAARTMAAMGVTAIIMFSGITALALITHVHVAETTCDLVGFAGNCHTDPQRTVIAQIAAVVFGGDHNVYFYFIQAATALILILAANTAFNGFPLLGSILAQDRYLPRQLHTRGDRLAFSNGILALAVIAAALITAFDGSVTRLIQLYILGVFTSFTLSQFGMVRHWNRALATERDRAARHRMHRSRNINAIGGCLTGLVLIIVLATKFTHGAYLVVIAIPLLWLMMRGIRRHYDSVRAELVPEPADVVMPSRIHAVVLVSTVHKPTLRALAFARASRPDTLTAVTVNVEGTDTQALQQQWEEHQVPVSLTIIESPYREITSPVVDYVRTSGGKALATSSPFTSPNTSSATGGKTFCTTSPRCASRDGYCSSPASWSSRCPGSCTPPPPATSTVSITSPARYAAASPRHGRRHRNSQAQRWDGAAASGCRHGRIADGDRTAPCNRLSGGREGLITHVQCAKCLWPPSPGPATPTHCISRENTR